MTEKVTQDIADRLSGYVDGVLSGTERAEIEALVDADPAVTGELDALREADMVVWKDRADSHVAIGPASGFDLDRIARDAAVAL